MASKTPPHLQPEKQQNLNILTVQKWDKKYSVFVKTAKHLTEEKQGKKKKR